MLKVVEVGLLGSELVLSNSCLVVEGGWSLFMVDGACSEFGLYLSLALLFVCLLDDGISSSCEGWVFLRVV